MVKMATVSICESASNLVTGYSVTLISNSLKIDYTGPNLSNFISWDDFIGSSYETN